MAERSTASPITNRGSPPSRIEGDRSAELSRLVRAWRARLEPSRFPGLLHGARARKTVSQSDVARIIGVTPTWYGKFERGEDGNYSEDFLDRAAHALRLSDDERTTVYLLAAGRRPTLASRTAAHEAAEVPKPAETSPVLARLVHAQPWPSYILDETWNVITYNQHMREWFPWVTAERNLMRWVFTYPEARDYLCRWETEWAPRMLGQMTAAAALRPGNAELAALIHEILGHSDFIRNLWHNEPHVHLHPDGDRRAVRVPPRRGVTQIEIVALEPLRASGARVMHLVPLDD